MEIKQIPLKNNNYYKETKNLFDSEDGKIARLLNKVAINVTSKRNYNMYIDAYECEQKATKAHSKLLFSEKKSDLLKKCVFIDPKTLKTYYALQENRNKNEINVSILDSNGTIVKNSNIKPFKVLVIDDFTHKIHPLFGYDRMKISHGETIKQELERGNPFNNYEFIDASAEIGGISPNDHLEKILYRLDAGEKIDVLSCSFGIHMNYNEIKEMTKHDLKNYPMFEQKRIIKTTLKNLSKLNFEKQKKYIGNEPSFNIENTYLTILMLEEIAKRGVKVFVSSGNIADSINPLLLADGVEGVGAIKNGAKIERYSGSRKSCYTKHYENGTSNIQYGTNGVNYTNSDGYDKLYDKKTKELFNEIKKLPYIESLKNNLIPIQNTHNLFQYKEIPVRLMYDRYYSIKNTSQTGTSIANARRVANYTKYLMFHDLIK